MGFLALLDRYDHAGRNNYMLYSIRDIDECLLKRNRAVKTWHCSITDYQYRGLSHLSLLQLPAGALEGLSAQSLVISRLLRYIIVIIPAAYLLCVFYSQSGPRD